jgi:hypothetical protein
MLEEISSAGDRTPVVNSVVKHYIEGANPAHSSLLKDNLNIIYILTLKGKWYIYIPSALTITDAAVCIYVFRMILTVNSDYFLKRH